MNALLKLLFLCLLFLSVACNTQEMHASSYPIAPRKIVTYYGGGYRYRSYSGSYYNTYRYRTNYRIHHGYGGGFHHRKIRY